MEPASVLPYRTDALALAHWLEARARGRSADQLRNAVDSPKTVEGTAAAAAALGFVNSTDGELTPRGERYALAEPAQRPPQLREALLGYPPYREMLRALAERGPAAETEVRWIEAWWATRGFGGSESNRREGAAAFGRLADFAQLGEYVPGRRGRPTRIRWMQAAAGSTTPGAATRPAGEPGSESAPDLFTAAVPAPAPPAPPTPPGRTGREAPGPPRHATADTPAESPRAGNRLRAETSVNRITVPLTGEATARIEVPLRLPRAEKRRLLDLLELLITEE